MPESPDLSQELPPGKDDESQEQGYCIRLEVTKDGYEVSGPEPLPSKAQGDEYEESESQPLPDLTTAVKHILAIVKDNPIGETAHDQFKQGYESA